MKQAIVEEKENNFIVKKLCSSIISHLSSFKKKALSALTVHASWLVGFLLLSPIALIGQLPHVYYLPFSDAQLYEALEIFDPNVGNELQNVISIVTAENGAIIYYDHWEDGFEADINNPIQATTQVWGDNNPANGMAPGYASDVFLIGDYVVLDNLVDLPRNPSVIKYDGCDRINSNHELVISRIGWATSPGPVLAGAVEVLDASLFGTHYVVPVGENTADANEMFESTSVAVMAISDNTLVEIDKDADGIVDVTVTLFNGQSHFEKGGLLEGATVNTSKPVQVHLVTGDIGARFESRWFALYPPEFWDASYFNPVGTTVLDDPAYAFIHNPNNYLIVVSYETLAGGGNLNIAANSTVQFEMPLNSGAHFLAIDGSNILGVVAMDAAISNSAHDWGFSMLSEKFTSTSAAVGYGPGAADLSSNGSPIWLTANQATTLYVDYDGNSTTGSMVDINGNRFDFTIEIGAFESVRIFDNVDNDQTGIFIYSLDGTKLSSAWGQDPSTAAPGNPFLDLGTAIPPLKKVTAWKASRLTGDANGNGLYDYGDTITYSLHVYNEGLTEIDSVFIIDTLPPEVTYLPSSTFRNSATLPDNIPPATSPFPADEGGFFIQRLGVGQQDTISYSVQINSPPPAFESITNGFSVSAPNKVIIRENKVIINNQGRTDCISNFITTTGTNVSSFEENTSICLQIADNDQNIFSTGADSVRVFLRNLTNGDREILYLIETGDSTGIFTICLPSSTSAGFGIEDGILNAVINDNIELTYTDPIYGEICQNTAIITPPIKIKQLYLSNPGQSLDRISPADTTPMDNTTAFSDTLGLVAGTSPGPTEGVALWADRNAAIFPQSKQWDGTSFDTEVNTTTVVNTARTLTGAAAASRDEKIVITQNNAAELYGQIWDGTTWTALPFNPIGKVKDKAYQAVEVAYESQSGDALMVWSDNATDDSLFYRIWDGIAWSNRLSFPTAGNKKARYLQLAASPDSDEMVLIYNEDGDKDKYAIVWDGNTWGNAIALTLLAAQDYLEINVVYEQQSGDAMVTYAKDDDPGIVYYRIWNGIAWSAESTITSPVGVDKKFRYVTVAADPSSDRIVMGVSTDNDEIWVSVWNGSNWINTRRVTAVVENKGGFNVAVAFEGSTGEAMVVYGEASSNFRYRLWTDIGGWTGELTGPALSDAPRVLTLDSDPFSDQIMLSVNDASKAVSNVLWDGASWGTITQQESDSDSNLSGKPFLFLWNQDGGGVFNGVTTFIQADPMCSPLTIIGNEPMNANIYISLLTGTMPVSPDIKLLVQSNSTVIDTLDIVTATSSLLTFSSSIAGNFTIAAGDTIKLSLLSNELGLSFRVAYDSDTNPSRIDFPTTTVITVDALEVYDAPYPSGNQIISALNGETVYIRTSVSDPFGATDVNSLDLVITDQNTSSIINTVLTDADTIATAGCQKIYEFTWSSPPLQGAYAMHVIAHEGYEGTVADTAGISFNLSYLDFGSPCMLEFKNTIGDNATTYLPNEMICIQITDSDQDTNNLTAQTLIVNLSNNVNGDIESLILTETGISTGIFSGCISSAVSLGSSNDNVLSAPAAAIIFATYEDPDDDSDICTENVLINTPTPELVILKRLIAPKDSTALPLDSIIFEIQISNPGQTNFPTLNLTDTFDDACLSFRSASINPSTTTVNSLSWNNLGTLNAGTSRILRVVFDAAGTCQNTINSVMVTGDDDVGNLGISAGPATATVSITEPLISLSKTLLNPITAPYYIGDTLTYELKVKNIGTTIITSLPLTDGYSISCLAYISSTLPPDGAAGGAIVWDNIGPLPVGDSMMIQVKFKILDLCTPLVNNAAIIFASDENDDKVPSVMDTVIIGVTNRPPIATIDFDTTFANRDTMVIVLLNEVELDSQNILLIGTGTNASNGVTVQGGTVTINDNGTIGDTSDDFLNYMPPSGFVGSDTLLYQICDDAVPALCDTAMVIIEILYGPLPPVVIPNPLTIPQDSTGNLCVPILDLNEGDIFSAILCNNSPSNGTANLMINDGYLCVDYSPTAGFAGTDSICIILCDQSGLCDTTAIPVTVVPPLSISETPSPPLVIPTPITTPMDSTATVCTPILDANLLDTFTASILGTTNNPPPILPTVNNLGTDINFTLKYNENTQEYEVYAKPTFSAAPFFNAGGNQISLVLPATAADNSVTILPGLGGIWSIGSQTFAPAADPAHDFYGVSAFGSPINFVENQELLLFKFTLSETTCLEGIRLFDNSIDPQSSAPGMGGGDFNNSFSEILTLLDHYNSNYYEVYPVCTTLSSCGLANGTATLNVIDNQLCVTYIPDSGFVGNDQVCVLVCDSTGLCDTVTIPVTVISPPLPLDSMQAPTAVMPPIVTPQNNSVSTCGTVLDNTPSDTHTVSICQQPTNGLASATIDNASHQLCVTFTPDNGFTGTDSLCLIVCDQVGLCDTLNVPIVVLPDLTTLSIKVLLQGAMVGGTDTLMRADLNTQGFLPLLQPYDSTFNTSGRFDHIGGGNESTTNIILATNAGTPDAIVDWVFIEIRDAADSTIVLRTISALVQRDGDVVDAATGAVLMLADMPTSFYVSVKHRNHLGVMTPTPIFTINNTATVDFTNRALSDYYTKTGYENLAVTTINGKRALWAGNANKDSKSKYDGAKNDRIVIGGNILIQPLNNPPILNYANATGYYQGDINMDGRAKYDGGTNDRIILQNIILTYPLNFQDLLVNNFDNLLEQLP